MGFTVSSLALWAPSIHSHCILTQNQGFWDVNTPFWPSTFKISCSKKILERYLASTQNQNYKPFPMHWWAAYRYENWQMRAHESEAMEGAGHTACCEHWPSVGFPSTARPVSYGNNATNCSRSKKCVWRSQSVYFVVFVLFVGGIKESARLQYELFEEMFLMWKWSPHVVFELIYDSVWLWCVFMASVDQITGVEGGGVEL